MFYTYGLSFDQPSSSAHSISLAASSSASPAADTRKNGSILALGAVDPQNVCGQGGNPFTTEYSIEYGESSNYILVTVGKFVKLSSAQVGFLLEPPTRFHLNSRTAPTASSQVSHLVKLRVGAGVLSVMLLQSPRLVFARPWHTIVAAKTAAASLVRRLTSKILQANGGNPFSSDFSSDFGGPGISSGTTQVTNIRYGRSMSLPVVTQEALQALYKVVELIHAVSLIRSQILLRASGRIVSVTTTQAVSSFRSFGKKCSAISAEIAGVLRVLPSRIAVASASSVSLAFGGGRFMRSLSAISNSLVRLQHGQATMLASLQRNAAALAISSRKILSVGSAAVSSAVKMVAISRGALNGQAWGSRRLLGMVKSATNSSRSALLTVASHLGALFATASGQIAALVSQHVLGKPLSAHHAMLSALTFSSLRTLLRSIGAASAQVGHVARGMATSIPTVSSAAQALARAPRRILVTTSSATTSLFSTALHAFVGGVLWPESVAQRASRPVIRGVASAESVTINRLRGFFLSAAGGNAARLGRGLQATFISTVSTQAVSIVRAVSKSAAVVWPYISAVIKTPAKPMSLVSAESSSIILRRGSNLGTLLTTQVLSLRRLTKRFLSVLTPQNVSGGRGGKTTLRTTSPNVAMALRPRGLMAGAIQGQRSASFAYYHFFVASWAYQQTTTLPPSGGVAEPPSFGPIDPADQTIFAFDWGSRAYPNDPIVSARVVSVPPGLPFLDGSVFISGTLIEVTVSPFAAPVLPTVFSLRCTATFASGRVSSYSIPVPVRTL